MPATHEKKEDCILPSDDSHKDNEGRNSTTDASKQDDEFVQGSYVGLTESRSAIEQTRASIWTDG
jgi:hypothetical protein